MATYGSTGGVNGLVQSWSGTANPTPSQVAAWLSEGNAIINRTIANAGYTAPVDASAVAYAEMVGLNDLYAGAYVLRALAIDTASGESEERSEVWLADFYRRLKDLATSNLALIGVVALPSTSPNRRPRLRTLQMRKVDGYSRGNVSDSTGYTVPSE